MKNLFFSILVIFSFSLLIHCNSESGQDLIDLSGEWQFAMDPSDIGLEEAWQNREFTEIVQLPGSMAENGKGLEVDLETDWTGSIVDSSWFKEDKYAPYRQPGNFKIPFWLKPVKHYKGVAWYRKNMRIPTTWEGKRILLDLERCHWETTVFVDDQLAGRENSLSVANTYDLTDLLCPGEHSVTLRVDNRMIIPVGINSHSVSDHTQSNWNGVVGKIQLQAKSNIYIDDLQIFPDVKNNQARIIIRYSNHSGLSFKGKILVHAKSLNSSVLHTTPLLTREVKSDKDQWFQEFVLDMGENAQLWSEFNPVLYDMDVMLEDQSGGLLDHRLASFGMREFKANGTRFEINGHPIFLRGTVECCIFPLTGHPPMDVTSWLHVFKQCKKYGLNHMRFHSWCPPEAAFTAADQVGIYLQVECGSWANRPNSSLGDGLPVDTFIYIEGDRIMKEYGNHPSLCMMAYGNEPGGRNQKEYLNKLVAYWKSKDTRRVYTGGAGWPVIKENQYHNLPGPRIQHWGEGLNSIINAEPPQTRFDFSDKIASFDVPVVSHEIGQWCVYPDFDEMTKYTGVLKPTNFEIFKETLEANNMGHQAPDFFMASGKLQTLCYKQEIEAALRTPGFAGFQLLQLHDFPGQGTALVGILDPFFDSKEYVTPEIFSKFCSESVPLARMDKRIYMNNEDFSAGVEMAHYGPAGLTGQKIIWEIQNQHGAVMKYGSFEPETIPIGNCTTIGAIEWQLNEIDKEQKLTLVIQLEKTNISNSWDFWVYPAQLPEAGNDILITDALDESVLNNLAAGGKVLLMLNGKINDESGGDVAIGFSSIFWNTAWTSGQAPHTLGILCDPEHPVFKHFPTEYHSNWQWWDPVTHSQAMIMDRFPADLKTLIQPIDTWFENRRLALMFEARVGAGKLMVCSIDLSTDLDSRPVARQLKYSVLDYMEGDSFDPEIALTTGEIRQLTD